MPVLKYGRETADPFLAVADDAPLPDTPAIVSLKRFRAERDALLTRAQPLGVELTTADNPEALGDDVHRLAVVAIKLPLFKDGRVFSWARVLRTRMRFTGEIRATGHFLIDQIAFMTRVGVDAFDLPPHISVAEAIAATRAITQVYQASTDHRRTIWQMRTAGVPR